MGASKQIAAGAFCGIIAGALILGCGGRLIMTLIAVIAGLAPGYTAGGTLEVIAFGAITGALAGAIYPLASRFLPQLVIVRGSFYGLLVYLAVIIAPGEAKMAALSLPDLLPLTLLLFALLFAGFGIALSSLLFRLPNAPAKRY